MQKGKHWNAKYQPKPQLWSLRGDVFKARHCWGNVRTLHVWGISLPVRIMFCKDDWDHICYSACHLYHEVPRLEPRKPPRKWSHTFSRIEPRREQSGGKPYEGRTECSPASSSEWEEGDSSQVPGTSALTARPRKPPRKTPPNTQKRSRLILSSCPNFKCHL